MVMVLPAAADHHHQQKISKITGIDRRSPAVLAAPGVALQAASGHGIKDYIQ
jgi:hypothetical protein